MHKHSRAGINRFSVNDQIGHILGFVVHTGPLLLNSVLEVWGQQLWAAGMGVRCPLRTGNGWGLLTPSGKCCVSGHILSHYCLPLWGCAAHSGRLMGRRWGDGTSGALRTRGEDCFLGESELVGLGLTLCQNFLYPWVPLNLFFFFFLSTTRA